MGFCKQLASLNGKTVLEHVLEKASKARVEGVILVLGFMAEKLLPIAARYPKVKPVFNPEYQSGLSSSIKVALRFLPENCEAAVFMLGDQPLVKVSTINRLVEAYKASGKPLVAPFHKGVRGNPILISKKFFGELGKLKGDVGGRVLLSRFGGEVLKVEVDDPGILIDIDSPADLKAVRRLLRKVNHSRKG